MATNEWLDAIASIGIVKSENYILKKEKDSLEVMVKDLNDRLISAKRQISDLQMLQKKNYELATDSIINMSKLRTISMEQVNTIITSLSSQKTAQLITQRLMSTTTPDDWKQAMDFITDVGKQIKGAEYNMNPMITGSDDEQKIREGEAIKNAIRKGPQEEAVKLVEKYFYFYMSAKTTYEQAYNEELSIKLS